MQIGEKIIIAHQLSRLGVDVCEAGFPVASPGDFEAVAHIAKEVGAATYPGAREGRPMTIAGLARAAEKDIDRCFEAVRHAPRHRIHTFLATSDIHLKHKLKMTRAEALRRAAKAVAHARALCADVEFSTEDGGRSDPAYLVDVIAAVIEAGAGTINVPDTVGYTAPAEYGALFAYLIKHVPGADRVVWSTHCHNDLGLATANTLAAVQAGARQVEVTINGIGERAGNTALEEVVMALSTRPALFPVRHTVDTTQIMRTSRMVSLLTGMAVQPNKAVVGANAFAHEAGIHQDGMLKEASTYEIMTPASVGLGRSSLVLGKHSGRHAFQARLRELGFSHVEGAALDALVERFKALADEKKSISDADIEAIAFSGMSQPESVWTLRAVHVFTGTAAKPTATVTLYHAVEGERSASAMGTGPVDAVYNAIRSVVGRPNDLTDFHVKSVTDGHSALGEVTIRVAAPAAAGDGGRRSVAGLRRISMHSEQHMGGVASAAAGDAAALAAPAAVAPTAAPAGTAGAAAADVSRFLEAWEGGGRPTYSGTAIHRDIIVASAHAYVAALNRLLVADARGSAVHGAGAIGSSV